MTAGKGERSETFVHACKVGRKRYESATVQGSNNDRKAD